MRKIINYILAFFGLRHKVGTIRPKRGHKLFEFNIKLRELNEVKPIHGKAPHNKNCVYITALNKKNAAKKFLKNL